MARTVAIGNADFADLITNNDFYVDKTYFIKEWWENRDTVTLITRPRRFGKTLTMNMVERFFSVKYAGEGEIFENLNIWEDEKFQKLQGTIPVISLTFAGIKCDTCEEALVQIKQVIADLYLSHSELRNSGILQEPEAEYFDGVMRNLTEINFAISIRKLCGFLQSYYKKKVIILLDEFDTPLQAAYVHGYWDKLISFVRGLFEATFKINPSMYRAILTGITRVSKESLFSGLNNLKVVSMTSDKYADSFGFTQEEVSTALKEFGLKDK
ncbi:MAG: AAA family ATPase, partial [Lachnospiraceae bacterium]|nr:AAA family ATPase [Lachnospiraceae bacterium]